LKDRIPTKLLGNGAIRYGIYDATGSLLRYEYIRPEDEPTEEGGAWSKSNVLPDAIATALGLTGDPQVKDALSKLSMAALRRTVHTQVTLSSLADGTEFTLNETVLGATTQATFIKLQNNYQSSGRVLVLRKDTIGSVAFHSSYNAYSGGSLDTYLNTTYIGYLDSTIRGKLTNVTIPYTIGNGNNTVSTISRKCFALSATEYGYSDSYAKVEGSVIPFFSVNGVPTPNAISWLRSPRANGTGFAFTLSPNGSAASLGYGYAYDTYSARPAFTLPSNHVVDEYDTNSLTDMFGNDFVLTQIASGKYQGMGTYGENNPNSLTFEFAPKLVVIIGTTSASYSNIAILIHPYAYSVGFEGTTLRSTAFDNASSGTTNKLTWTGSGVSWYLKGVSNSSISNKPEAQCNSFGTKYFYLAIG